MKLHYLVLVVLVVCLSVLSTASALWLDSSTWIRTYSNAHGKSAVQSCDKGYIIAGSYNAASYDCCDPWVINLDSFGNVLWHKIYEAEVFSGMNNLSAADGGGYVFSAYSDYFTAVKIDECGDIEWAKSYGAGSNARVYSTPNDGYFIIGQSDDGHGRIVRLDTDGDIVWQKTYGDSESSEKFHDFVRAWDGDYIVIGEKDGDYWAVKIDSSGVITWEYKYGGEYLDQAYTIIRTNATNSYYLIAGESLTFTEDSYGDWWAVQIDEDGDIIDQFSYGGYDYDQLHAAIRTSDAGWILSGGSGSFQGGNEVWLIKFDQYGDISWQKTYGTNYTEHARGLALLDNSKVAVIGDSYGYPSHYDIWLMKINSDGTIENDECGDVNSTSIEAVETDGTKTATQVTVDDT